MILTDNEKRGILKLIEAGKPLPDNYRFYFDDKREVELVWNGKTNEVTNIVQPLQVIEQINEPSAKGRRTPHRPESFAGLVKNFRKYKDV